MGPPASRRISRVPRYSGTTSLLSPSLTGLSPAPVVLSNTVQLSYRHPWWPSTPAVRRLPVWPLPFSLTGLLPSLAALSRAIQLSFRMCFADPQPRKACSSVWALPSSLAATERIDFSFLSSGYLDVSVPQVPSCKTMYSSYGDMITHAGFPHSDVHGSKPACGSPWLFAAGHVLLRRLVPWHPPYALVRFIFT